MKYNVYTMIDPNDTSILEYVDNVNVVVPDMIDGKIDLVYVKEGFHLPTFIQKNMVSYNYSIPYEEVQRKLQKKREKGIKKGSFVWNLSKWKKVPFIVEEIKDNKAVIKFDFKGKTFIKEEVDINLLTPIDTERFYIYGVASSKQIYKQIVSSNNAVIIDGDYIKQLFGESFSTFNTINLIFRIRSLYPEYQVIWVGWRNKMIESVFKNLLDLPIINHMVIGKLYLTDQFYQLNRTFQDTLMFDSSLGTLIRVNYSVLDFVKKELWKLQQQNIFGIRITNKFINSLNLDNFEEKLSKFPEGKRILQKLKNKSLPYFESEAGRVSPQEILSKLEKVGWKWMVENFYYYFDLIYNVKQRRIYGSI